MQRLISLLCMNSENASASHLGLTAFVIWASYLEGNFNFKKSPPFKLCV